MLPSPSSSPVQLQTLHNFINLPPRDNNNRLSSSNPWLQLPTPPKHSKRPSSAKHDSPSKRAKVMVDEEDSETEEKGVERARIQFRRRTCNPSLRSRNPIFSSGSTRTILESFVSSCKSDFFRCESAEDGFLTPPYACSYSHAAKRGSRPLLAVSTEEGSVHIFNTSKREEWDPEPPVNTLRPHTNGVFDVKWSSSDAHLATCSGDKSARISCPNTSQLLHTLNGHSASLKCVSWHPSNDFLLCTGARDGIVCAWDLRIPQGNNRPVLSIPDAHEALDAKVRKAKQIPKSITNLVFSEEMSVISSGSSDGILRCWDLRFLSDSGIKRQKTKRVMPSLCSPTDPTTSHGSRRPRGILSLTAGLGPSTGLLFALGADSRIHTYSASSLTALPISFADPNMHVNGSFYISSAVSPCGRWLATGGGGSTFSFDVAAAARPYAQALPGVELKAQLGEVYAVDWAEGMLASCADDRTVRVWRPDVEVYRRCLESPEEYKWRWNWASPSSTMSL